MVTVANLISEYAGLKDDTKPIIARNGDLFIEMDTGKTYLFDEEGVDWVEQPASGGGGGGGSSDFAIATVGLITSGDAPNGIIYVANVDQEGTTYTSYNFMASMTETIYVVLYKGYANYSIEMESGSVNTSGDIDHANIYGDATIYINGGK